MKLISVIEVFAAALAAIGGIEGVKGLISWWRHRKAEKRKVYAEADSAEVSAEKALRDMYEETLEDMRKQYSERINELHASLDDANRRNHDLLTTGARKDDIIEDKTAKIRSLQDELLEATRTIGRLEKTLQHHKNWFCQREYGKGKNECMRREPAQNPPLKYEPLQ